jgi:hypothetical protein
MKLAAAATDPILKQRLSETAQRWNRLAIDLAKLDEKIRASGSHMRCQTWPNDPKTTALIGQGRK